MSWIYFVFIWIGIFAVWYAVRRMNQAEGFVDGNTTATGTGTAATGTGTAATGTGTAATAGAQPTAAYKEALSNLPKYASLRFYLTSFSDLTSDDHKTYVPEEMTWYNYMRSSAAFKMVGTIPDSVRQIMEGEDTYSSVGLPLKPVKLVGPASHFVCGGGAPDSATLRSFSVMFYGRLNALAFDNANREVVFLKMFAENPGHVKWSITRKDATNSFIELILGDVNTVYRWSVPNSTLLSNGNPTLYALVHNVESTKRTINIYVGTNKYTASSTDMTPIRLGYTPMEINSLTNLDMTLQAFAYMDTVLTPTDIPAWTEHFVNEAGGLSRTLRFLRDTYTTEITTLTNQLTTQTNDVDDLQRLLDECRAKLPKDTLEEKKDKWKIKMEGAANISTEDAQKCTILSLSSSWGAGGGAASGGGNVGIGTTGSAGSGSGLTPITADGQATHGTDETAGLRIISPVRR